MHKMCGCWYILKCVEMMLKTCLQCLSDHHVHVPFQCGPLKERSITHGDAENSSKSFANFSTSFIPSVFCLLMEDMRFST